MKLLRALKSLLRFVPLTRTRRMHKSRIREALRLLAEKENGKL